MLLMSANLRGTLLEIYAAPLVGLGTVISTSYEKMVRKNEPSIYVTIHWNFSWNLHIKQLSVVQ